MAYISSEPIATRWLLDSTGDAGRRAVRSVCMIVAKETGSKGTGFLLTTGHIMTAFHVIEGCSLANLRAIMSNGRVIKFKDVTYDPHKDLAVLKPSEKLEGGLEIHGEGDIKVGVQVYTWGYPLGYNGPAPLLTVGFLSGFIARRVNERVVVKHLVVNSAFNPGNSGGPLFVSGDDRVIGVVVSKHLPMPPFIKSAIEALRRNQTGVVFKAVNEKGEEITFIESQIVAEILEYYRSLTQVVIGEAVAGSEVISFLGEIGIIP